MSKIIYTKAVKNGIIECYNNNNYVDVIEKNNYIAIEPYRDADGNAVCITMLDKNNNFLDGIILYEQDICELIKYGQMQYNKELTCQSQYGYFISKMFGKKK